MNHKELYHALRRGGYKDFFQKPVKVASVHHAINARAPYRDILDRCVENGKIGVVRSGMDCDCVQYRREYIIDAPTGAIEFAAMEDAHYQGLDGPESGYFQKPSETEPGYKSRDRALEAYEDGHPSTVYWGDLD